MQNSDKIVIDTYAWVEYFKGSSEGLKAKKFIEGNSQLFTPSIVIAELSDKYRRENIEEWHIRKRFIKFKSRILDLNDIVADKAGELKLQLRKKYPDTGLADAIIFSHSMQLNGKILTGDNHLRGEKNSIDITK